MSSTDTIVVLMPTYNDWESVAALLPKVDAEIAGMGMTGRVVVVDDGSAETEGRIRIAALPLRAITSVVAVELYRNMGNQRAIAIGIAYCAERESGRYLAIMDSDHEDRPEDIRDLVRACAESGDRVVAFAERSRRSEGFLFRMFYAAYRVFHRVLTGLPISIGNFSVAPWGLVGRLARVAELWSHYPAAVMRARFPIRRIPTVRGRRIAGHSKMSMVPLVVHALSGFTVQAEVVGTRVLLAAVAAGLAILGLVAVAVGLKLFTGLPIVGWTSQIVGMLLVMLFQVLLTMVVLVFLVVSVRMQAPMIPLIEFGRFVAGTETLFGHASVPSAAST